MPRDVWVTSDTHFYHDNIITYCKRPFDNSAQMNECLLENWNSVVKPGDIVYHLGDVLMGGQAARDDFPKFWAKFHGKKRLIVGNHDDIKFLSSGAFFEKVLMWRLWEDKRILFTHVPVHEDALWERAGASGKPINVHGHTHTNGSPKGPYKSVCVELTDYKPVHIEELLDA